MPIDLSKLPDKAKPGVDLSGLPDKEPMIDLSGLPDFEEQEERASFGKELLTESWKLSQDIGSVYPMSETAATIITSFYGLPIAGLLGLHSMGYDHLLGPDFSKKVVETVTDWLIYKPVKDVVGTPRGQHLTESAFYPIIKLDALAGQAGNKILEETNSPLLAASVHALIAGAPAFLGLRASIMARIRPTVWWRRMAIRERGVTIRRVHDYMERNPEASEAAIINQARSYGLEELAKKIREEGIQKRRSGRPGAKKPIWTEKPEAKPKEGAKPPIDLDKSLETIRKDAQRPALQQAIEQKIPVERETLLPFKGEEWADAALLDPNALRLDIPTDEAIDTWMQIQEDQIIDTGLPEVELPPDIIPIAEEPISYEFKAHVEAYVSTMIDLVRTGEPGQRIFIEKGLGEGGGQEVIGFESTYPEWMRDRGWTAEEVMKALEKGIKGEKLGTKQEAIFLAALEEAQEMFLADIDRHMPEQYAKAEATIDMAMTAILGKVERLKEIKKHLRDVRKALKQRPVKAKKKKIREITGQTTLGNLVREDLALNAAMKKTAAAARKAFSEGNKAGVLKERMRLKLIKEKVKLKSDDRKEFQKMVLKLRKVKTTEMTPEQAAPIDELLSGLDLVRLYKPAKITLNKTKKWMQENEDAEPTDAMIESVERLDKVSLNDITLNELRDIFDAVMHHVKLEKLKTKLRVRGQLRDQMKVLNQAVSEMKPVKEIGGDIIDVSGIKVTGRWQSFKDLFGIRQERHDLIIESLGGPESVMHKVLFKDVKDGQMVELKYRQDAFKKFSDAIIKKDFFGKGKKIPYVDKWLDEAVTVGRYTLTRNQRMALYMHSLNPDNLTSLIRGGFGVRQPGKSNVVYDITPEEIDAIIDSLTPEEKAFVGPHVQELFTQQGKDLAKVFLEKNFYPLAIEPNYYPKEVMPIRLATDFEAQDAFDLFKGKTLRPGVFKGMTKTRLGSKKPIYLNGLTYDVNKSVERTAAYVGLEIPLSNASKMMYDKYGIFRSEIDKRYGAATFKNIEQGLRDIAGDWHSYSDLEKWTMKLKNVITPAMLGLNPRVIAFQLLQYPFYWVYLKPEFLIKGMVEYIFNAKELAEQHKLFSAEYTERATVGPTRDIADVAKAVSQRRLFGGRTTLSQKTMAGIKALDLATVTPGMRATVLQVLAEFEAGKLSRDVKIELEIDESAIPDLTPVDKMKLAYKYADFVTERTQDMFSKEHQSPWQRGGFAEKMTSMFGSYPSMALSVLRRAYRDAMRRKDAEANAKLARAIFIIFGLNTLGVIGVREVFDWFLGKKKKRSFVGRVIEEWSGLLYLVRDIVSSAISKMEKGTWLGHDVGVPVLRPIELLTRIFGNAYQIWAGKTKAKRDKAALQALDDAIELGLMMHGLPYEVPKQVIKATAKRATGEKP